MHHWNSVEKTHSRIYNIHLNEFLIGHLVIFIF